MDEFAPLGVFDLGGGQRIRSVGRLVYLMSAWWPIAPSRLRVAND